MGKIKERSEIERMLDELNKFWMKKKLEASDGKKD